MKINKHLSSALDTEFITDKKAIVPMTDTQLLEKSEHEDVDSDFSKVRTTLHDLIAKGSVAIEDMHHIAQHDEQARSFEVLATLIKTVSETAEKLLDSHEKRNRIKTASISDRKIADDGSGINIDKAVFLGTTADLLKKLKQNDTDE